MLKTLSGEASSDFKLLLSKEALKVAAWQPNYLVNSAWLEHIPFAFWLIWAHRPACVVELGTHRGASYFAFCQAVDALNLNTRCYAVDNWVGDEHAGHYSEDIYRAVSQHNEALYARFSNLVRKDFNAAADDFDDNSIDLLHIDGFHTYEAVKNDFETWLPKLASNAIVLFHDTNVHDRNFGVYRFFSEIKDRYQYYEFFHGYGLGVLVLGKPTRIVKQLNEKQLSEDDKKLFDSLFYRLGNACKNQQKLTEAKQLVEERRITIKKKNDELNKREEEWATLVSQQYVEMAELSKVLVKLQKEYEKLINSSSWRVTAPLRLIVQKIRKYGSGRLLVSLRKLKKIAQSK
ncbi:hypothetical protein GLV89_13640 [Halomonas alkaliantarctica]|nr:hypothetical protein [Halomonas alkaliantarctica]